MPDIMRSTARLLLPLALIAPLALSSASAQRDTRKAISIGNYPRVDGIRINFRDRDLERVRGANITIWRPYDEATGDVSGLALGLPITSAGNLTGVGVALFGIEASDRSKGLMLAGVGIGGGGEVSGISVAGLGVGAGGGINGITIAGLGAGSGGRVSGITIGGLGVAGGGDVRGLAAGGLGVGAGGDARGIIVGGLGAGVGGDIRGMALGGLGAGAGGDLRGLGVGGVGVGVGGRASGILVGGVGVGAGGGIRGIAVGGVGVGAGGTAHGLIIGGIGVGAERIEGAAFAPLVGAEELHAVVIAPALLRTGEGGRFTGVSISSVNAVRGDQRGLTIGIVNYARSLRGAQLGVVNIVRDNPSGRRVLPIINWGR
ncbi:MAG: hypothetical protein ACKVS7_14400 [Gemmatimonadaceae bacterium]